MHRVCLVGAGNVSRTHADALAGLPTAQAVAVCDPDAARARTLAQEYGFPHVFNSLDEAIGSGTFDSAHVLVPPSLHASIARRLLAADIGVLLEKPMALSSEDCTSLVAQARRRKVQLGVNHNAVFYPAYLELRARLLERRHGALQHLIIAWNLPRQSLPPPAHWMTQRPQNLAFETAVHPFSQVHDLAGPLMSAETTVSGRRELGAGQSFFDTWQVSMVCERATAQVFVSYGGSHRLWQLTAICEDGVVTAEAEQNRITALDSGRWGRYYEPMHAAVRVGGQEVGRAVGNVAREVVSSLRPNEPNDPYFMSMKQSIATFHGPRSPQQPRVDGDFAKHVVMMCESASDGVAEDVPQTLTRRRVHRREHCDVLVTGGTGFIGRTVVDQLVSAGAKVRVMARSVVGLPDLFYGEAIHLIQGDVADADAARQAVRGARTVIHLATGDWLDFDRADASIIQATDQIAQACLREDVERLVFAGTIASLYLGDPLETVTESTPTDPLVRERGPYAWAKARAEERLQRYFREQALPICIVRPGVVLGGGGTPFHSGFGIWRGNVHCVGWNDGTNPLPLVLDSDVATAIVSALSCGAAVGRTYNLVGDVRPCARECVDELRLALERPLVFHPRHPAQHQAVQVSKWLAKSVIRRRLTPGPSYRAIKSAGCVSQFDCSVAKTELGWTPVADRSEFIDRALRVHARRPQQEPMIPALAAQRG